ERLGVGLGHRQRADGAEVGDPQLPQGPLTETMVIALDLLLDVLDQLGEDELDRCPGAKALGPGDADTEPAVKSVAPPVVLAEDFPDVVQAVAAASQSGEEDAATESAVDVIDEFCGHRGRIQYRHLVACLISFEFFRRPGEVSCRPRAAKVPE